MSTTSRCSSSACTGGNCEGCKNGVQFCDDPRCYPNCPDCPLTNDKLATNDWVLIIIILALIILIGVFAGIAWWDWSEKDVAIKKGKSTISTLTKKSKVVPMIAKTTIPTKSTFTTMSSPRAVATKKSLLASKPISDPSLIGVYNVNSNRSRNSTITSSKNLPTNKSLFNKRSGKDCEGC